MIVSALVLENEGTEDQAIATLLHDAAALVLSVVGKHLFEDNARPFVRPTLASGHGFIGVKLFR
jgi:hypothetical protein